MQKTVILYTLEDERLETIIKSSIKTQFQELVNTLTKENQDELLTREETLKLLKIDSSTLWHWTKKGKVKAYGISNRRYYKRQEILNSLTQVKV